jgi:hypothetical protein
MAADINILPVLPKGYRWNIKPYGSVDLLRIQKRIFGTWHVEYFTPNNFRGAKNEAEKRLRYAGSVLYVKLINDIEANRKG